MAITAADFKVRFPEFNDVPDARVTMFIEDTVTAYIGSNENRWNGRYNLAQSYLTAHLLTTAINSEVGDTSSKEGGVIEKAVDGVKVKLSGQVKDRSSGDAFYMGTIYGQQYIVLRNRTFIGATVGHRL